VEHCSEVEIYSIVGKILSVSRCEFVPDQQFLNFTFDLIQKDRIMEIRVDCYVYGGFITNGPARLQKAVDMHNVRLSTAGGQTAQKRQYQ
jgi:hypothetical protein